ncbi:hypothetical protein Tco_0997346 [Tanacetum coccineum]
MPPWLASLTHYVKEVLHNRFGIANLGWKCSNKLSADGSHSCLIGNGCDTWFWLDNWLGGSPLKVDFPCLFRLDSNTQCLVCNRSPTFHTLASTHVVPDTNFSVTGPLPYTGFEFHWAWRRPIRSGPESDKLTTLCNLVAQLRLTDDIDLWECTVDDTRFFTVKGMSSHIINTTSPPPTTSSPTRWNNLIPLKVNVFTW